MRHRLLLAGAAALLLAGFVVLGGLVPIQASSGHWRVTAWMLDLIKRRSIDTYSYNVVPPRQDLRSWIGRGAAHYESGCRPCHGSPLSPRPAVVLRMTPHPPELPERIARWSSRELFQIVRHGIKFTAMPAWAAPQRPDEVWAMVSFLRALPRMSAEAYSQLAFGSTTTSDGLSVAERCVRCHGEDGMGRQGTFPVLAGQRPEYLRNALRAYRSGRRHSGFMQPEAAELDEAARETAVAYFSQLPRRPPGPSVPDSRLVFEGEPARQVPACSECHGPASTDRNPAYPILAGQPSEYLLEQLILFSENRRGGSEYAPIMQAIASRLTREQMREAADYYSSRSIR